VRWPWVSARVERAEKRALDAERRLAEAQVELAQVQRIAAESKAIKRHNGFTDAIRTAMGVR
jgi:hypothetical protein